MAVRFGNVLGSSGSVIPIFQEQIKNGGPITITNPEMERYFMSIPEASQLILQAGGLGKGGEIFIPKLPSYDVMQLTKVINADAIIKIVGIRPGEKIHESMFSVHDSVIEKDNYFVLVSDINLGKDYKTYYGEKNTNKYDYNSGENIRISDEELKKLVFTDKM